MSKDTLKEFAKEVEKGLSSDPKNLPSKYFYDQRGDKIFQEIMRMEEYYPTDAEYEIFSMHKERILELIQNENQAKKFQLVELGAGDGFKTKVLLSHLLKSEAKFEYLPIDISPDVLKDLQSDLNKRWPDLECRPIANTYAKGLKHIKGDKPKVVMFLGGNIGNFTKKKASKFIRKIAGRMKRDDLLIFGIDLKKDPELILRAYNDSRGITRSFNLNLLQRINRELEADFKIESFSHFPTYDPISGVAKSHLISMEKQNVRIAYLDKEFSFDYAEPILTEVSIKYSLDQIEKLFGKAGLKKIEHLRDCKHYFVDTVWKKTKS